MYEYFRVYANQYRNTLVTKRAKENLPHCLVCYPVILILLLFPRPVGGLMLNG